MKPYWQRDNLKIYCGNCIEILPQLEEKSALIFTSPPYNHGKAYGECEDNLSPDAYIKFLWDFGKAAYGNMISGGRLLINLGISRVGPYIPYFEVIRQYPVIGWLDYGSIVWVKGSNPDFPTATTSSTAWGSWMSPSNPHLRGTHEIILWFFKDTIGRKSSAKSDITKDEFVVSTLSTWSFAPQKAEGHPAAFPVGMAERAMKFLSWPDDLILDPFLGSGTTLIACAKTGRPGIGIELSEKFCELAAKRIEDQLAQPKLF